MFGLGDKDGRGDRLSVQVYAVGSEEAFRLAQKIWDENVRTVHLDGHTHKEFLRFSYASPKCIVWLQRDRGRTDTLELIVYWNHLKIHEVFVLMGGPQAGDDARAKALLNSMLTTPAVLNANT